MPVRQTAVLRATDYSPDLWTDTLGRACTNLWSAECQGRRTEQRQRISPSLRIETEVAGNRTQSTGLEDRDCTDHATTMDMNKYVTK